MCLLCFRVGALATKAGNSRTEPQVQANSTILTCAVEKRQIIGVAERKSLATNQDFTGFAAKAGEGY
jgi:hypothetical protein